MKSGLTLSYLTCREDASAAQDSSIEGRFAAGGIRGPRRGKGSHTIWKHIASGAQVNLAGADGEDAHAYQERAIRSAIALSQRIDVEEHDVTDR